MTLNALSIALFLSAVAPLAAAVCLLFPAPRGRLPGAVLLLLIGELFCASSAYAFAGLPETEPPLLPLKNRERIALIVSAHFHDRIVILHHSFKIPDPFAP